MNLQRFLILTGILCLPFMSSGQRLWDGEYNRLGLQAGINHFTIQTSEPLPISSGISWTAGFTTWDSFYNDFMFIYGINFYDLKLTMDGRENEDPDSPYAEIPFTMLGVQANFFGSYKIVDHYLSIHAGPILQLNGKFDARQDAEYFTIEGFEANPIDLEEISKLNFNLAIGLAGGLEKVKLWVQYQYGVNNIFKKLTDDGLGEKDPKLENLTGHISMVTGGLIVFL
ncbi:hypothetical protein [Salinimicrobium gaetbulicola]|uniref:Outer membrane protein with beta-barrel domain n=1 Tax=Salinimicrobium gaetbulicola TaxID=999702 RepID=A0ABW3IIX4_9FLAO